MKILALIPVWERPTITNVCMDAMVNSINHAEAAGIELLPLYVVSEKWAIRDANARGFPTVWAANSPLGEKLNAGLQVALTYEWDYLMTLGSDDIVYPSYWIHVRAAIEDGLRFFGVNRLYIYDTVAHRAKLCDTQTIVIGAGRCVSRDIVTQCGKLWPDEATRGMDLKSEEIIEAKTGVYPICLNPNRVQIVDLKGTGSMNAYDAWHGTSVPPQDVEGMFGLLKFVRNFSEGWAV